MATDSALFTIEARPAPVSFAAAQTAVIVVDMQNDFGSPEGMFGRAGIDLTDIRATIEPTRHVLASARRAGMKVVYLKMAFRGLACPASFGMIPALCGPLTALATMPVLVVANSLRSVGD